MKKAFTYLFVSVMSALIFYGGAGINVISYCCDTCRAAGIEEVSSHKCCVKHGPHQEHQTTTEHTCENCIESAQAMCCGLERLQHDWSNHDVSNHELTIEPVAVDLLYTGLCDFSVISTLFIEEYRTIMLTGPPLKTPRTYLSLLTTLLI